MPGIDAFTKLMLHCDGTDGSTTFTDSSASNHSVNVIGNSQIDTSESVFGGASALFDGSSDSLTISDSPDWNFGSNDFTVDFRLRFTAISNASFFSQVEISAGDNLWYFLFFNNQLFFEAIVANSLVISVVKSWTPSINQWYHIAFIKTSNTYKIFVDGIQIGTDVIDITPVPDFSPLAIIGLLNNFPGYDFNGRLDEFRISNGIARWTTNFIPPISSYSEDSIFQSIQNLAFYKKFKIRLLDKGNLFFDLFKGKLNRKIPS